MTAWTARVAVLLYLTAIIASHRNSANSHSRLFVKLWEIALAALTLHVLAAFHFVHNWSWQQAVDHTTRQTERVVGQSFGIEIWSNVAFLAAWLVDLLIRRVQGTKPLPRIYERSVQGIWAFMFFNATVVFGPTYWRWLAPIAATALILTNRLNHAPNEIDR